MVGSNSPVNDHQLTAGRMNSREKSREKKSSPKNMNVTDTLHRRTTMRLLAIFGVASEFRSLVESSSMYAGDSFFFVFFHVELD